MSGTTSRARILAGLSILAVWPSASWAQVRAGGEFRVSTYTTGYQYVRASAAAAAADGGFVVVWESGAQDGNGYTAMASRFDASGARLGIEFIVNAYTTGNQYFATIGMSPRGRFVVAWQSYAQDGSQAGVFGQRFERDGRRAGAEFQVNSYTSSTQSRASVGLDDTGGFAVSWRSVGTGPGQDGDSSGVFAQRFSAAGAGQGGEFLVNTYTTDYQNRSDLARASDGTFVVTWQSYNQEGPASGYGVYAKRYAADGSSLGAEFRVNTYTTGDQARPSVAVDAAGAFVVAWTEYAPRDGSLSSIRAQRFSAGGAAVGAEFQANSYTTGAQLWPQVGVARDGGAFVVAWTDYPRDGSGDGVFGRRFDSTGTAFGSEFQANSYTTGNQYSVNVAVDAVGNFVLVWNGDAQDGSRTGVYAQRYGGLLPTALGVDTGPGPNRNGNGVFEPGEAVDVRPSWRNVSGSSQTFSATLSGMTGPAGATYIITVPTGTYGTVANNAIGACTGCFEVSVNNPPARPLQHWDASALETISPLDQGQQKRWTLHIGNSFTDVPNASGFYRFIETLLHHTITGGCGATQYCPASPTSREQMAVFVLVAKEGPGFVPPACTTPVFNDVPAASPFCRWIEELARRGVVGGCGGGNYCPASAVTREQMAVFVLRTLDPTLNPPACVPPNIYGDVPETSAFCRWIEELTNRGIVSGCGGGNYCPLASVTREQMGVFIGVTFALTLYGP